MDARSLAADLSDAGDGEIVRRPSTVAAPWTPWSRPPSRRWLEGWAVPPRLGRSDPIEELFPATDD